MNETARSWQQMTDSFVSPPVSRTPSIQPIVVTLQTRARLPISVRCSNTTCCRNSELGKNLYQQATLQNAWHAEQSGRHLTTKPKQSTLNPNMNYEKARLRRNAIDAVSIIVILLTIADWISFVVTKCPTLIPHTGRRSTSMTNVILLIVGSTLIILTPRSLSAHAQYGLPFYWPIQLSMSFCPYAIIFTG